MIDALAAAGAADPAAVRRAVMVNGSPAAVGGALLTGGSDALRQFRLTLFRPLLPMLAQTAPDVAAALARTGRASVETKYDGARVQVHRAGRRIAIYTRNLREVSANLPEIVAAVAHLPVAAVILDGEVIALRPGPIPAAGAGTDAGTTAGASATAAAGVCAAAGPGVSAAVGAETTANCPGRSHHRGRSECCGRSECRGWDQWRCRGRCQSRGRCWSQCGDRGRDQCRGRVPGPPPLLEPVRGPRPLPAPGPMPLETAPARQGGHNRFRSR